MKSLVFLALLSSMLLAKGLCVVTAQSSSINEVSVHQLRDVFLQKRKFIDGKKVVAVNFMASNSYRIEFEKTVLKMQRDKLNSYWVRQHFQGISPPITQASPEAMKRFIQNVEGSIGYLPREMLDESLKVLYEF
ncbi:MAG: hypothetical protein AB7U24_03205 [Sulfurimonadaceae bacterium]|jgi:hypothetical protein